jgi:hypothetical protein
MGMTRCKGETEERTQAGSSDPAARAASEDAADERSDDPCGEVPAWFSANGTTGRTFRGEPRRLIRTGALIPVEGAGKPSAGS